MTGEDEIIEAAAALLQHGWPAPGDGTTAADALRRAFWLADRCAHCGSVVTRIEAVPGQCGRCGKRPPLVMPGNDLAADLGHERVLGRAASASARAMAGVYIRREWNSDANAMEETATHGLSMVDQKVLGIRFGDVAVEVGAAIVELCKRELASRTG